MATHKSPSKASQNKSKLSALKNLVANVTKGAVRKAAAKKAAADALAAKNKSTSGGAGLRVSRTPSGSAAESSPKGPKALAPLRQSAKAASPGGPNGRMSHVGPSAPATSVPKALARITRGGSKRDSGAPVTRLNNSLFQNPVPSLVYGNAALSDSICREVACEALGTTGGYCRLHYIKNWKKIQRKAVILQEKKLNGYIEELVVKYPEKYLEAIRMDLADDVAFAKVIADLDLDESVDDFEGDSENVEAVIDTIKRDFDEDGEF